MVNPEKLKGAMASYNLDCKQLCQTLEMPQPGLDRIVVGLTGGQNRLDKAGGNVF